jgi:hypothetical protein
LAGSDPLAVFILNVQRIGYIETLLNEDMMCILHCKIQRDPLFVIRDFFSISICDFEGGNICV